MPTTGAFLLTDACSCALTFGHLKKAYVHITACAHNARKPGLNRPQEGCLFRCYLHVQDVEMLFCPTTK